MKNLNLFPSQPSFTLPNQLELFIEKAAEDIKIPKTKDLLCSRLKEDAWNIYQNAQKNGLDKDQAEAQTIETLGDIQTIKTKLQTEAESIKNQENLSLWKVPMAAAVFFSAVACVSLISCILYQINNNGLITLFFSEDAPSKEIHGVTGITTYGNLIGSSFLWLFLSLLFAAICITLVFILKRKYKIR